MSLFQPSNRQAFKAHAHVAGELCPLCDQPIAAGHRPEDRGQEARAIPGRPGPGPRRGDRRGRAEGAGGARRGEAGSRDGDDGEARRDPVAARPGRAGQGRGARADDGAEGGAGGGRRGSAWKSRQDCSAEEDLQREKDTAVLAEKGEGAEAAVGAGRHAAQARGQVGATSWARAPRSTCSSSCAMPSRATASSAFPRASTVPT